MERRLRIVLLLLITACLTFAPLATFRAEDTIALSLAVNQWQKEQYTDEVFAEFEAANPGVKVYVNVIEQDVWVTPPAWADPLSTFYESVEKYASSGDVILMEYAGNMPPEATTAGYFLDLAPLANGDTSLNADDFYKSVWEYFQWDGGIWALPYAARVSLVTYDPAALDESGVAHPDETWTLDDYLNAARQLMQKDADGKVTRYGLDLDFNTELALLRLSLPGPLADTTVVPNAPQFASNEALMTALEAIYSAKRDKLFGPEYPVGGGAIRFNAPLAMGDLYRVTSPYYDGMKHSAVAMLPGGKASIAVSGFAVSGGTSYPELAYRLARYLTTRKEPFAAFNYLIPARKSLANEGLSFFASTDVQQAVKEKVLVGLDNGLTANDLRYFEYVNAEVNKIIWVDQKMVIPDSIAFRDVLQAAEAKAAAALQDAISKRGTLQLSVPPPPGSKPVAGGKAALKFALLGTGSDEKKERWQALFDEFSAADAQIGRVDFEIGYFSDLNKQLERLDCAVIAWNPLSFTPATQFLALDPLMADDPTFDKADLLKGVLEQFQRDGRTFGFPLTVEIEIMRYNAPLFDKAGVPQPVDGWTIEQFLDALKQIKTVAADPNAPVFVRMPRDNSAVYLLTLMAALGGLPMDYRTDPPTINLTDPATVDAIRQTLDLAKQGYISYEALYNFGGGGSGGSSEPSGVPIYGDRLMSWGTDFGPLSYASNKDDFKPVMYPTGKYNALSYITTTGYISASSAMPEACYRLMSRIAQRPDLFNAMPARKSMLDNPALNGVAGQNMIALYRKIAALAEDPTMVPLPTPFGGSRSIESYQIERWMVRAFDRYVLENADLEAELQQAHNFATEYLSCTANVPRPQDADPESYKPFQQCAESVDPTQKLPGSN